MPEKDKDGKLTYKMTSPGEAYMNFTNSKEGHNAGAVTPEYLKEQNGKGKFEQELDKARSGVQKQINDQEKQKQELIKQASKEKPKERGRDKE